MSVLFRPAGKADLDPLVAFARETYVAAFGHSLSPDDLSALLDGSLSPAEVAEWIADDVVLLVEDDGELIGFAHAGSPPPGVFGGHPKPGDFALYRLYVAPGRQSRGLGQALMDRALALAPPGADIYLDVWEENVGAQRLYGRNAFGVVGQVKLQTRSGAEAGYDFIMKRSAAR